MRTIFSLVPLLAALSFIGTRVFDQPAEKSLELFVQVLPYAERTVTDKLREFLAQAEEIQGIGLAALFATSLFAEAARARPLVHAGGRGASTSSPWRARKPVIAIGLGFPKSSFSAYSRKETKSRVAAWPMPITFGSAAS